MLIVFNHTLYLIELTVGFESNVNSNSIRKMHKYSELVDTFSLKYDAVKFVNVSMGTLGMFGTSCDTSVAISNEVGTTQGQKNYVLRSMTNITIRCTYSRNPHKRTYYYKNLEAEIQYFKPSK